MPFEIKILQDTIIFYIQGVPEWGYKMYRETQHTTGHN